MTGKWVPLTHEIFLSGKQNENMCGQIILMGKWNKKVIGRWVNGYTILKLTHEMENGDHSKQ